MAELPECPVVTGKLRRLARDHVSQLSGYVAFQLLLPIVLCFSTTNENFGQNLVPNHSFEQFRKCPTFYSQSKQDFLALDWESGNQGTPDLFNKCGSQVTSVPYNYAGVSEAYDGQGYAGLFAYMEGSEYREYLLCKLSHPLLKDSLYIVRIHYKLSSYSKYAIDRLGLLLSASPIIAAHDRAINIDPTFNIIKEAALTATTGLWESYEAQYLAKGNEQYLVIGNFSNNKLTRKQALSTSGNPEEMLATSAYYYIDDVAVIPATASPSAGVIDAVHFDSLEVNRTYILSHISFEFAKANLLEESFQELNNLASYLRKHKNLKVVITGHTDDQGDDDFNEKLSWQRAGRVADYLHSQGIAINRISTDGRGEREPLGNGTDEAQRKLNRRVEIKLMD